MVCVRKLALFSQRGHSVNTIVPCLVAPTWLGGESRTALYNMAATRHVWLLKFQLIQIRYSYKFGFSVTLVTFQVLNSHVGLMVNLMASTKIEHFHQCKKFFRTACFYKERLVFGTVTCKVSKRMANVNPCF